jgi:hypothetical protein
MKKDTNRQTVGTVLDGRVFLGFPVYFISLTTGVHLYVNHGLSRK